MTNHLAVTGSPRRRCSGYCARRSTRWGSAAGVRPARERAGRLAACIAAEQDLIDRARCRRRDGAAYGHRGRAFALGYIQGLIEMMELDDRQPEGAR